MKKTNKKDQEKVLESTTHEEKVSKAKEKDGQEKVFTNIKKLKCDYKVYKRERERYNMPVEEKCAICEKKFKEEDKLYIAYKIEDGIKENCIICGKCAK